MVPMKSNDHWAFLEEIEAPMWVDLTLEGKSSNQKIDDKWFCRHHPIHQCSSHDLKSAFSQLFEDLKTSDFELSVSCSPNLPDSVSRSRGKDYDNKKWKGTCQDSAVDKHIISEKLSSGSATKLKLRSSFTDSKRTSSSKSSSVVSASCLTENSMPNVSNPVSIHGDLATGLSSRRKELDDSGTSSSIITGISHLIQQKLTEVTNQPLGNSSTLLSVMRRSLRKSCVTRQASRLEVSNRRRQSSGHNSSSSNSSVSSSLNPGFGAKSITSTSEQHQKKTRGIGSFSRMTHSAMNKSKVSSVSSTLMIQVEDWSSNSRREGKIYNARSAHLEASKPEILRANASLLQKRDEQNACLKPKKREGLAGTAGRCKTAVAGKENAMRRIAASQKCDGREPSTFGMAIDQKRTQNKVPQRVGRRSVVSSKEQGKNCHPSEGRNLKNETKRVHLR